MLILLKERYWAPKPFSATARPATTSVISKLDDSDEQYQYAESALWCTTYEPANAQWRHAERTRPNSPTTHRLAVPREHWTIAATTDTHSSFWTYPAATDVAGVLAAAASATATEWKPIVSSVISSRGASRSE